MNWKNCSHSSYSDKQSWVLTFVVKTLLLSTGSKQKKQKRKTAMQTKHYWNVFSKAALYDKNGQLLLFCYRLAVSLLKKEVISLYCALKIWRLSIRAGDFLKI